MEIYGSSNFPMYIIRQKWMQFNAIMVTWQSTLTWFMFKFGLLVGRGWLEEAAQRVVGREAGQRLVGREAGQRQGRITERAYRAQAQGPLSSRGP